MERRLRRAWREGAGPLLRPAGRAFRAVASLRSAAWEAGVLRPVRPSIPVISVGGLTVGGEGKTPLAADLAGRIAAGRRVGIVTHGYADEMRVHRVLNPGVVIRGGDDRVRAVEAAAAAGAELAVVDGGFQHRRLWRDADVVALAARRDPSRARCLPAGPYREGWSALGRADAVVVVRRASSGDRARRLARAVRRALADVPVARCRVRPVGLRPANARARAVERPDPAVAVASIMYPEVFLAQLERRGRRPATAFLFPDHAGPDPPAARRVSGAAGGRGVVGTLKDAVKLRPALPPDVPLWYLAERLEWEAGEAELTALLEERTTADRGSGNPGGARP